MNGISSLKEMIPDFGKDIRLNLENIITEEGSLGLTREQILGIALASAYATQNKAIIEMVVTESEGLAPEIIEAAKAAATIMAMNNVYYRFVHLAEDKDFLKMPARLRMNIIGKPGIAKVDFELMALAVSALSGCGLCINSHIQQVRHAGVTNEGIQSTIRIPAVLNAVKQALAIS